MSYILFVDDEEDIREIVSMNLQMHFSHELQLASSGEEALKVIETHGAPSVIITDYRMPNGDGAYLFREVRKRDIQSPIIICSANAQSDIKLKIPDAFIYIAKPRILQPILEALTALLVTHRPKLTHIAVGMGLLLKMGDIDVEIYIKIGDKSEKDSALERKSARNNPSSSSNGIDSKDIVFGRVIIPFRKLKIENNFNVCNNFLLIINFL